MEVRSIELHYATPAIYTHNTPCRKDTTPTHRQDVLLYNKLPIYTYWQLLSNTIVCMSTCTDTPLHLREVVLPSLA